MKLSRTGLNISLIDHMQLQVKGHVATNKCGHIPGHKVRDPNSAMNQGVKQLQHLFINTCADVSIANISIQALTFGNVAACFDTIGFIVTLRGTFSCEYKTHHHHHNEHHHRVPHNNDIIIFF